MENSLMQNQIAVSLLDEDFEDSKRKELLDLHPWMHSKKFSLLTKRQEIQEYIDKAIRTGECAVDFETEGLNTRLKPDGNPYHDIVGVCLSCDQEEGVYIPVNHEYDKELNVPKKFIVGELKRLVNNCVTVYHYFKFDGSVLINLGIEMTNFKQYEDTLLMSAVEDVTRRSHGLKELSEDILSRPMIEIKDLLGKDQPIAFKHVPIKLAVYYGGADALNTLALKHHFKQKLDEQDHDKRQGPWTIYEIEKKAQFVVIDMERNLVRIDIPYLKKLRKEQEIKRDKLKNQIIQKAGKPFDIDSPKQLGHILFEHMGISYPKDAEKTKTGQWQTDEKILSKLVGGHEIINWIMEYRSIQKLIGTYIDNFINNADENDCVKFQLNQTRADTGRFSATGGQGLHVDGYSGVNCQNISKQEKDDDPDLRRAIIARKGFKLAAIDYSGEELRIAANLSKEPKWIDEFLYGKGDIHSITTRDVYDVTKEAQLKMPKIQWDSLRDTGKKINFLTLYGGGAHKFSVTAKVSIDKAQIILTKFFRSLPTLKKWIDFEKARSRKRGYSRTAFGRRRNLNLFYQSGDPKLIKSADRKAVNSAIQGTGADIIKISLYRVWKWIKDNGYQDRVKILFPVHDEIVYEIKEDELNFFIPEIAEIMKMDDVIKKGLKWKVGLEVDAEYGDTWHVTNDFFKELKKQEMSVDLNTEKVKVIDPTEEKNNVVKDDVPEEDCFVLKIKKIDTEFADRLKKVIKFLTIKESEFEGPKKRIKLMVGNGQSKILRHSVSVDGFKALLFQMEMKEIV